VSKGGRKVAAPAAAAPPTAAPATPRLVRKPRTVADVPALALPILTPEAAEGIAAQISAMPRETAIEVASMIAGLAGLDIDNPPAVEPAPAVEAPAAAGVPLAELATVRAAVRKHARTLARRRKPVRKAVKRRRTSRKVARKAKARRPRRPVRKAAKRRQGGAR
jgi:hypothetical protein